ncbi:hypothetical protein AB5J49_00650 [Streptomyces sp. R28]|uniref:Uncharacterized protein n=1 Tax=Streptomyces sp. R28 TaxID=3238628 RepID=A0AB39PN37_9ACTN
MTVTLDDEDTAESGRAVMPGTPGAGSAHAGTAPTQYDDGDGPGVPVRGRNAQGRADAC